jgi:hypothetical protein
MSEMSIARTLRDTLISEIEEALPGREPRPAKIVDGLFAIARAISRLATNTEVLSENVDGISSNLEKIAAALRKDET